MHHGSPRRGEACPAAASPWLSTGLVAHAAPINEACEVRHDTIGRGLRVLRHRRGWRQRDVATRSAVSRSVVADLERGQLEHHQLVALTRVAAALGSSVRIDLMLPGGDLHRLLDADHAALQARWADLLERAGWSVMPEVTFNHFGERGSVDLLAFHPGTGNLVVVEIKTLVADIQDLLSGMDRKARLARTLAADQGWDARHSVPALVIADGTTVRRRIADHAALFSRFELRGRRAAAWLRSPEPHAQVPRGLLLLTKLPRARPGDLRRAGRQRIRPSGPATAPDRG